MKYLATPVWADFCAINPSAKQFLLKKTWRWGLMSVICRLLWHVCDVVSRSVLSAEERMSLEGNIFLFGRIFEFQVQLFFFFKHTKLLKGCAWNNGTKINPSIHLRWSITWMWPHRKQGLNGMCLSSQGVSASFQTITFCDAASYSAHRPHSLDQLKETEQPWPINEAQTLSSQSCTEIHRVPVESFLWYRPVWILVAWFCCIIYRIRWLDKYRWDEYRVKICVLMWLHIAKVSVSCSFHWKLLIWYFCYIFTNLI